MLSYPIFHLHLPYSFCLPHFLSFHHSISLHSPHIHYTFYTFFALCFSQLKPTFLFFIFPHLNLAIIFLSFKLSLSCFIDYCKLFDCLSHQKMMCIFESTAIYKEYLWTVVNFSWNQPQEVRTQQGTTGSVSFKRVTRLGCAFSPHLFKIYSETILRQRHISEQFGKVYMASDRVSSLV